MTTSRMSSSDREAKHSGRSRRTSNPSLVGTLKLDAERAPNVDNVGITSMKTDMEMKNAVHRQRRTLEIKYAPPNSTTLLPRPKYHDAVPGTFPPSFPQRTTTNTSHGVTGALGGVDSSYTIAQIDNGGGVRDGVAVERLASDGVAAYTPTLGGHRRNASTISFFPNKLHLGMSDKTNSPRNTGIFDATSMHARDLRRNGIQSPCETEGSSTLSKPFHPGFKLKDTLTTGSNNLFGFSRSLTSDRLTRHPQDSSTRKLSYNDDMDLVGERKTTEGSVFLPQGQRGYPWTNASPSRWSDKTFESSKGGYIRTVSNPHMDSFQVFTEGTPASLELKTKPDAHSRSTGNLAGFSSMDLADSIIKAVSENIDEVYHLCQTKVKYSDFIEKTQPHRLFGSQGLCDDSEYSKKENAVLPRAIVSSKSTMTFRKSAKILPSLVLNPHDSTASIPHSSRDTDSRIVKETLSNSPLPEPEIDYDKPITIIIESNQDGCHKATRPILKLASRSNLGSRTFEKTRAGDLNNNNLTESRAFTSDGSQLTGDIFRTQGRLVRFNFDTTIHEFTPSEPVLSPK